MARRAVGNGDLRAAIGTRVAVIVAAEMFIQIEINHQTDAPVATLQQLLHSLVSPRIIILGHPVQGRRP